MRERYQVFVLTSIQKGWELGTTDFDCNSCCRTPNNKCTILGNSYARFVPSNSKCPTKYVYVIGSTGINRGTSFATCLLLVRPAIVTPHEKELGVGGVVINREKTTRRG